MKNILPKRLLGIVWVILQNCGWLLRVTVTCDGRKSILDAFCSVSIFNRYQESFENSLELRLLYEVAFTAQSLTLIYSQITSTLWGKDPLPPILSGS